MDSTWLTVLVVGGLGLFLLSVLMLGLCFWYRRKRKLREEKRERVNSFYRPLFFEWIAGATPELKAPDDNEEWIILISLWNDLYEKVGSSEREQLRGAADELNLKEKARELMEKESIEHQITAVITLGNLGDEQSLEMVKTLSESSATILKMQSIKALSNLKPQIALKKIYEDLANNPNQSPNYYKGFCRLMDRDVLTEVTLDWLEEVGPGPRSRIIPFLEYARNDPARQFLSQELSRNDEPELLSACLKVLRKIGSPSEEPIVASYLDHEVDFVRIQAARTLGSIGTETSREYLLESLSDPNWWARLRAAQSLVQLPSTSLDDLQSILPQLSEEAAQNALQSALAEAKVG